MSQQHVLDIREYQRPPQQWVVEEKDLANGQIVRGAPIGVHSLKQVWRK